MDSGMPPLQDVSDLFVKEHRDLRYRFKSYQNLVSPRYKATFLEAKVVASTCRRTRVLKYNMCAQNDAIELPDANVEH